MDLFYINNSPLYIFQRTFVSENYSPKDIGVRKLFFLRTFASENYSPNDIFVRKLFSKGHLC